MLYYILEPAATAAPQHPSIAGAAAAVALAAQPLPSTEEDKQWMLSRDGAQYGIVCGNFSELIGNAFRDKEPIKLVYANPPHADRPLVNGVLARGNLLMMERGVCTYDVKVRHALQAGARGVVISNSDADRPDQAQEFNAR